MLLNISYFWYGGGLLTLMTSIFCKRLQSWMSQANNSFLVLAAGLIPFCRSKLLWCKKMRVCYAVLVKIKFLQSRVVLHKVGSRANLDMKACHVVHLYWFLIKNIWSEKGIQAVFPIYIKPCESRKFHISLYAPPSSGIFRYDTFAAAFSSVLLYFSSVLLYQCKTKLQRWNQRNSRHKKEIIIHRLQPAFQLVGQTDSHTCFSPF